MKIWCNEERHQSILALALQFIYQHLINYHMVRVQINSEMHILKTYDNVVLEDTQHLFCHIFVGQSYEQNVTEKCIQFVRVQLQ